MRADALVLALLLAGCRQAPPPATRTPKASTAAADTLVLTTPGGRAVWLAAGREAIDSAGRSCRERTIEIRDSATRVLVPLLYTGDIPVLINDSTIEARLWLHCTPGDPHRVNLRTGQPVRRSP